MKVSKFCFGCEALGGNDWGNVDLKEIEKSIHNALDLGINFFDTAAIYGLGLSEIRLSKILGKKRYEVILATKGGLTWGKTNNGRAKVVKDSSKENIRKGILNSLSRLRIESIPIYYIHWPDETTPLEETFSTLEQARKEGLINKIGCSNFGLEQLIEIKEYCKIDFLQIPMNILEPFPKKLLDFSQANNLKVIPYNVLASGLLTGKYDISTKFLKNDRRSRDPRFKDQLFINYLKKVDSLKKKARDQNLTITQYSIKEVLNQKSVESVIIGIKNTQQLEENIYSIFR